MTIDELLDDIGITPGEWEHWPDEYNSKMAYDAGGSIVSGDHNPWYIATIEDAPGMEVNARLIAVSREMLKALIDVAHGIDSTGILASGTGFTAVIESATGMSWDQIKEKLDG